MNEERAAEFSQILKHDLGLCTLGELHPIRLPVSTFEALLPLRLIFGVAAFHKLDSHLWVASPRPRCPSRTTDAGSFSFTIAHRFFAECK